MHDLSSCFVLGYHGCDARLARALVLHEKSFEPSENRYDWLGHGIYFWLEDPLRALEWAEIQKQRGSSSIKEPGVVGAVVDLGQCLDLTTRSGVEAVCGAYRTISESLKKLPENRRGANFLDCLVINTACKILEERKRPVDTVKGLFIEGKAAYPGAAFMDRTHVQICVRNPVAIKALFLLSPREMEALKAYQRRER